MNEGENTTVVEFLLKIEQFWIFLVYLPEWWNLKIELEFVYQSSYSFQGL